MSDAFITTPVLRSRETSQNEKKLSTNHRQKIIAILKSFSEKELLFQAANNIGIPKNFINPGYIESRPEQELNKIYNTICALKKEVLRIKRYSDTPQISNIFAIQSVKVIEQSVNRSQSQKDKDRNFVFLKKQIPPQKKIKLAIEKQLEYRQKLQKQEKKLEYSDKIKAQFNQKRKEAAKSFNKKVVQVYERQKQIQENQFAKVMNSQPEQTFSSIKPQRNFNTADSTRRQQQNYDFVKERLEKTRFEFQNHLNEQVIERVIKQNSFKEFKHRRLNSLNDRILQKQMKMQYIRERKSNFSHEQETQKLKKLIHKEMKIIESRQQKNSKETRNSEIQTTTLMTTMNFFRNSDVRSINFDKEDEKQNMIMEKLARKNELRQSILNTKVEKMKQKHRLEQYRRQAHKKSQIKLLTESDCVNDSFVYQKDFPISKNTSKKGLLITQVPSDCMDPQQQNIRKKHQTVVKNISCDQTIMRLRKLPKSILEQKLKALKNKELQDIFAKNIVRLIN